MEYQELVSEITTMEKPRANKIGPKIILTMAKQEVFIKYMEEMVRWGCLLDTSQLKSKVAEITQTRLTPFTNGIFGNRDWSGLSIDIQI